MQFITDGPDIPNALLQAHEEGRVVFFCGAGISYPAGLPGFKELVSRLYSELAVTPNAVQQAAIRAGQFDAAIGLLEEDIVGGRKSVRSKLTDILTPDITATNATKIHESLLMLSKLSDGRTRLITTNFDRVFEEVITAKSLPIERFQAPLLPVPKNRWDGLVYLHGLLSSAPTESELDRLVVTSGDFGLAYLTERWAARFVSELFRNFSVCFIGYSINDPVLRYMVDALAADRSLGEDPPEMFAFGSYSKGKEKERANAWRTKNVTPILYREHNRHAYLRQTLQAWAETYRAGALGKEAIVVKHALTHPQASTRQDDFVGRMLWALSDKSGLPAKRFAEFKPAPPLEWLLDVFADERFQYDDLTHFGVPPHQEKNKELRFSLIRRPAPYQLAQPMRLVSDGSVESQWDMVMSHLARWLLLYLDDPRLVIWIAERGGQLHDPWSWLIEKQLDRLALLEREGKTAELDEIRLHAPKAIPGPLMRTLWRLLLSGRVKSPGLNIDVYSWKKTFQCEGFTTALRWELRKLLAPKVILKKPFSWSGGDTSSADEPMQIKQLVDWELALTAGYVNSALDELKSKKYWKPALPQLLDEFQQLLRDALDLLRELDEAGGHGDRSSWYLPSITPYEQNRGGSNGVILIELLRDAWMEVREKNRARATRIAQNWFYEPSPIFKRLALFAASHDDCIPPEQWVNWLLADDAWWLWSIETRREVCRLLDLQGQHLQGAVQGRLEAAILMGPPEVNNCDDLKSDGWQDRVAHSVWLYLAKLKVSGLVLGASAATRLVEVSEANPLFQLANNEREEFLGGISDVVVGEVDIAPRKRSELVQWLVKPQRGPRPFYKDTWREVCGTRFFHSLLALSDLARKGAWPANRWRVALQTWAEKDRVLRSWRYAAPLVQTMPDAIFQEIAFDVTWWMCAASKSINCHEDILLTLCHRVQAMPLEADTGFRIIHGVETYDPVGAAINHPVGHVTLALINLWFKQNPNDNDLLPTELEPMFTTLCDAQIDRFRHGRALLCSHLISLSRVDNAWTEQHLLPLFDWRHPELASLAWQSFLWSPRFHQPLFVSEKFKPPFLECAKHLDQLGGQRQQYVAFLTEVALDESEGYYEKDFRDAFDKLLKKDLERSALVLYQTLASAGEQSEEYWLRRVKPFWQQIWPKSRDRASPQIAKFLTGLVIAARNEFPDALSTVQHSLSALEYPSDEIILLKDSGLCEKFPVEALLLLKLIINDQKRMPQALAQCLDEIVQAAPKLEHDHRYQALYVIAQRWHP